jgi:hypothetical protein
MIAGPRFGDYKRGFRFGRLAYDLVERHGLVRLRGRISSLFATVSLIVQHYIEEIGRPDHLRLVSDSDVFTPTGRTKIAVIWDLRVKKIDDTTCEFTNTVHSLATPELLEFLGKQGIPFDLFRAARRPMSEAHNRQETPLFAESIGRHAMARHGEAVAS